MKNSENFKTLWWGVLVLILGFYLWDRYPTLSSGSSSSFDVVVFIVWVAICLAPIFQEMNLFGFKFKQQMDDMKKDLNHQMTLMKTELKSSIEVSNANSNQIYFQSGNVPPQDSEIPDLAEQIQQTLKDMGISTAKQDTQDYGVDPVHVEMFKVRLAFENVLRNYSIVTDDSKRKYSIGMMLSSLKNYSSISKEVLTGVREVVSICNYAVHGEPLSETQISFVRQSAPGLLKALKNELQAGL
ncbi:hypothetical protein BBL91_11235 [Vibrio parahaemolyticus]|uniref:hypothetical protein n=1 Tax=Vibrio parahaemolyticus TaxID=670 RepID=UPI00084AEE49|nr:hypothetical protein [Vibrio parahaemolyticus]ODW69368.1 hypothetical protein BBL91_11235 [Vibrio parahaemolyticus]